MCDPFCCFPQYEAENAQCNNQREVGGIDPDELNYYMNAGPPTPRSPASIDSIFYPSHYLAPLHPIIVQPPPNRYGAHGMRQLTHGQRASDLELPASTAPGPAIYIVSNGIITMTAPRSGRRNPVAPGRAVRSRSATRTQHTHAPPGYASNPPSRGGAETAEPPPYPEPEPEPVPEYPGRGDGTMSAPWASRRTRI